MKKINKEIFVELINAGLIKDSKMEKNFRITGRKSKRKRYYVTESRKIMEFLASKDV